MLMPVQQELAIQTPSPHPTPPPSASSAAPAACRPAPAAHRLSARSAHHGAAPDPPAADSGARCVQTCGSGIQVKQKCCDVIPPPTHTPCPLDFSQHCIARPTSPHPPTHPPTHPPGGIVGEEHGAAPAHCPAIAVHLQVDVAGAGVQAQRLAHQLALQRGAATGSAACGTQLVTTAELGSTTIN